MIRIFFIVSGIIAWIILLLYWLLISFVNSISEPWELKKINTALQADERVSAYLLSWYEGSTGYAHIWLDNDKYVKLPGFTSEILTSYAPSIWGIGPYTVICMRKYPDGSIDRVAQLSFYNSKSVNDIEVNSIFDVFSEYDTILERVSRLPEVADPSQRRLPDDTPLGTCYKKTTTQPSVDIPKYGFFLQDKGFSFYTK